jgi:glycosyltransferase involved in cell wall biosynthesis
MNSASIDEHFISVVVVAHNSEKTIAKCIEHLLNQNYSKNKYEIIIVNDGSTDKTVEIIKEYSRRYPIVKFISLPWHGIAYAENFAIKNVAKGEIICLTNSDCYAPTNFLEKHSKYYKARDIGAVGGIRIEIGDNVCFAKNPILRRSIYYSKTLATMPGAYNCSFRKYLAFKVGFFDETLSPKKAAAEDTDLFVRIVKNFNIKIVRDETILVFHDHPLKNIKNLSIKEIKYAKNIVDIILKNRLYSLHELKFLFSLPLFLIFIFYVASLNLRDSIWLTKQYDKMATKYSYKIKLSKVWFTRTISISVHTISKCIFFIRSLLRCIK